FAAKTEIGLALTQQPFGVLAIDFQTVRLAVRRVGSADVRPFVPVEAEPLDVVNQLIFKTRLAAFHIGVFHAKHHRAAVMTGKKPVEQRGAGVPDVQLPGWRGSEPYSNGRIFRHRTMLTGG